MKLVFANDRWRAEAVAKAELLSMKVFGNGAYVVICAPRASRQDMNFSPADARLGASSLGPTIFENQSSGTSVAKVQVPVHGLIGNFVADESRASGHAQFD